jgi:Family of unknown function (DUF5681)
MSNKSGRGNPPEHSRFKKGVAGNPKGRPKRKREGQLVSDIISQVQNTLTAYREGGRTKLASRLKLILKKLVNAALGGDPKSADDLFTLRTQAERNNGARIDYRRGLGTRFPRPDRRAKDPRTHEKAKSTQLAFGNRLVRRRLILLIQFPRRRNLPGMNEPSDRL